MNFIDKIQHRLHSIYGIEIPEKAGDFLIGKEEARSLLKEAQNIPREVLLVRKPDEESVEVALFLDPGLIANLKTHNPFDSLNEKNISDFCTVVEGVSHFVYFLWKAHHQQNLTQLEMELQAEIDKFLLLYFYASSHDNHSYAFMEVLFDNFALDDSVIAEAEERYMTASKLAAQYCYQLQKRYGKGLVHRKFLDEIRNFYHLSQDEKIHHIIN